MTEELGIGNNNCRLLGVASSLSVPSAKWITKEKDLRQFNPIFDKRMRNYEPRCRREVSQEEESAEGS